MSKAKKIIIKTLKIIGKIFLGIFIFFLLLIFFVRSPWGQNIIKDKVIFSIEDKTGAQINLEKIFITFKGDIQVDDLFIQDAQGDTIVFSESISANIPLLPIIKGQGFNLTSLDATHVRANLIRKDTIQGFNYEVLMDAFVSDTLQTQPAVKDTAAAPTAITLGNFNLKNFDVKFRDDVTGINSRAKFQNLKLSFNETDLDKMVFHIQKAMLEDADINYDQTRPFPPSEGEASPMPVVTIENLDFKNVKARYNSEPDSLELRMDVTQLDFLQGDFNLKDSIINAAEFKLSNSDVFLGMQQSTSKSNSSEEKDAFEWPGWKISIGNTNLQNNNITYIVNNAQVQKGKFNPNAIVLENLDLKSSKLTYAPKNIEANISKLNFKEGFGIQVDKFEINALVNNEGMEFKQLDINADANSMTGNVKIDYQNFDDFLKDPGSARIVADVSSLKIQIADLYRFQPDLQNNEYINALSRFPVSGSLKADGKMDNIRINSVNLRWKDTRISGNGTIINATNPDKIAYNFPQVRFNSTRNNIQKFVKESDLGIQLPETINITGSFTGNSSNIKTNSRVISSKGNISVDGNFEFGDRMVFNAEVQGDNIALGEILQNKALGNIELEITASGNGNSMDNLNATLNSTISSFSYNDYEFRDIQLAGELKNGKGPVSLTYKDSNLDMQAQTIITLDTVAPEFNFNVNVEGANLNALGITRNNISTGFELDGWFKGNSTEYELKANLIEGVAVYNNESYLLGNLKATAFVREDTTSVKIDNRVVDLNLQSNASPVAFSEAIDRHFKRYITEGYKEDSIINPVNLKLDATIHDSPILTEVFLINLEDLDTIDVNIDFMEAERRLDAFISVPHITYYSSEIDSLHLNLKSNPQDLNLKLAFRELNAGPLAIKKTILTGDVQNSKLNLDFLSVYDNQPLIHISSNLNFQGDTLKFHVEPKELILNRNPWQVDPSNLVSFATDYLNFENFQFFREEQQVKISNDKPGLEKEHLSLDFKNFKLAALLNYFNPEKQLATGEINGNITYEEPFGETGIVGDMQIDNFHLMDVDLNTLSLQGESSGFSEYDFKMAVKGGEVDLDLTGSYIAAEPSAKLDMLLSLNEVQMSAVEGFSRGFIKDGSGSFSGNFNLNGTVLEPKYDGKLAFNNASFKVSMLNEDFVLANEVLKLDTDAIYFNDFKIKDSRNNAVVVNGNITTENLFNPGFDLDVQAKDFRLLNSTKEDNEMFYGTAVVDTDAQITGDLTLPKISMNIDVKKSTDFTYIVPETELQMKERDGIVIFVNKENPDDILSQNKEESYIVSGYDIFSRISVNKGATFNVIINQETGDKFQVQGEGDLIFNMYPNGRMALTGIYEINDGFYEMSLYNLVNRRFEIADGSRVSWAGDPFEAQLDVRAIYKVETSASSLMASQTSAVDPGLEQRYLQELPFLVYLNIDGELMKPKISFGLDMPENEQGAIGGQVFGRVQQLNNQEQELNKQVFSLLVLNRFFPESGSNGAGGGTMAVARDNLNSALSDQLNMLSSRIMGESGLQLNFNVDSFTDYQGDNPQDRTQLGISAQKAFLEDRLVVEVGSAVDIQGGNEAGQEASPVIGNVSISYLFDENGIWRIKGFSRSQFENVIDGQLVVSGIALIFTKEFNKFKNMFEKAVMENVQKKEDDQQAAKETENSEDEN
ncbi:translocation/assembly module TamB domain-containing protein [Christiangramia aquimixticola]|uniref:translocation/assembly module TamB domain-containing protein n=1 Tax=Christiangramia aquimixticola TaxID=1697558 RepID=UPI003AA97426